MEEVVSLEEVGQAEAVISRLIHERRSLVDAEKMLEIYRKVEAELQPAVDRLDVLKEEVVKVEARLKRVGADERVALDKVEKNVMEYKERREREIQVDIDKMEEQYARGVKNFEELTVQMVSEQERHADYMEAVREELRKLEEQLAKAKGEHAVLAEAVSRATGFFEGSKV